MTTPKNKIQPTEVATGLMSVGQVQTEKLTTPVSTFNVQNTAGARMAQTLGLTMKVMEAGAKIVEANNKEEEAADIITYTNHATAYANERILHASKQQWTPEEKMSYFQTSMDDYVRNLKESGHSLSLPAFQAGMKTMTNKLANAYDGEMQNIKVRDANNVYMAKSNAVQTRIDEEFNKPEGANPGEILKYMKNDLNIVDNKERGQLYFDSIDTYARNHLQALIKNNSAIDAEALVKSVDNMFYVETEDGIKLYSNKTYATQMTQLKTDIRTIAANANKAKKGQGYRDWVISLYELNINDVNAITESRKGLYALNSAGLLTTEELTNGLKMVKDKAEDKLTPTPAVNMSRAFSYILEHRVHDYELETKFFSDFGITNVDDMEKLYGFAARIKTAEDSTEAKYYNESLAGIKTLPDFEKAVKERGVNAQLDFNRLITHRDPTQRLSPKAAYEYVKDKYYLYNVSETGGVNAKGETPPTAPINIPQVSPTYTPGVTRAGSTGTPQGKVWRSPQEVEAAAEKGIYPKDGDINPFGSPYTKTELAFFRSLEAKDKIKK